MEFFKWSHSLLNRVEARLRRAKIKNKFQLYKQQIKGDHPLKDSPMWFIGDTSASPHELFSHYAAYSVWLAKKLRTIERNRGGGGGQRFWM